MIRQFAATELLKSAITSLHEPYFTDIQKDLSNLIVSIIHLSPTDAESVISSLPGLNSQPDRVREALARIMSTSSERLGRAVVLDLLEQIRGVSIHEMGRITTPRRKKVNAKVFATSSGRGMDVDRGDRGNSPSLEGVSDMF